MDAQRQRAEFWTDLASAARALVNQPAVPFVSLVAWSVACVTTSAPRSIVVRLIVIVGGWASIFFLLGWYGAERVFFQRHLESKPVALRHLLGLVQPFMGRFVALGIPFGMVVAVPICIMVARSFAAAFKTHQSLQVPTWFPASICLLLVAIDFALTFVTPALAYTTRSAWRALRIGFAMIRQSWPRCALYVLCPPLALNLTSLVFRPSFLGVRLALNVVLVLVGLLAKGAIAAFYLRERGSYSEDGAAYIVAAAEPPGSVPLTTPIDHRQSL